MIGNMEHADKHAKDGPALASVAVSDCGSPSPDAEHQCIICHEAASDSEKRLMHQGCGCRGSMGYCHAECQAEYLTYSRLFTPPNQDKPLHRLQYCEHCCQEFSGKFHWDLVYFVLEDDTNSLNVCADSFSEFSEAIHFLGQHDNCDPEKLLPLAQKVHNLVKSVTSSSVTSYMLLKLGNVNEAVSAIEEGVEILKQSYNSSDLELEHYGRLESSLMKLAICDSNLDFGKVLALAQRFHEIEKTPCNFSVIGRCLWALDRVDEAASTFEAGLNCLMAQPYDPSYATMATSLKKSLAFLYITASVHRYYYKNGSQKESDLIFVACEELHPSGFPVISNTVLKEWKDHNLRIYVLNTSFWQSMTELGTRTVTGFIGSWKKE